LVVTFKDGKGKENAKMKNMMHDCPGMVIRFMWEKFSHSKQAMSYVERCATGDIVLDGKKTKVFGGFRTMEAFLAQKRWVDTTAGPRIQQEPPWDEKPVRRKAPLKAAPKSVKAAPKPVKAAPKLVEADTKSVVATPKSAMASSKSLLASTQKLVGEKEDGTMLQDEVLEGRLGVVMGGTMGSEGIVNTTIQVNTLPSNKNIGRQLWKGTLEGNPADISKGMSDVQSILQVESTDWEDSELEAEVEVEGEVVDCATVGANHEWEEFASSRWVASGKREGKICDREFVEVLVLENKKNFTNTKYCPTGGNPAWGCKTCRRAMCTPCKMNYVMNEKLKSPGRNSGVRNDCARRRCEEEN
jgi:hypothetical protein